MAERFNRPVEVFKAGGVRAAVWSNTVNKNGAEIVVYSVQIDRTYKDGEEFKRTSKFNAQDLPRVSLVANKAFEWICFRNGKQNGEK